MRDILRICRSDTLRLRDFLPGYVLRLELDQECYVFVDWWATCDSSAFTTGAARA